MQILFYKNKKCIKWYCVFLFCYHNFHPSLPMGQYSRFRNSTVGSILDGQSIDSQKKEITCCPCLLFDCLPPAVGLFQATLRV